MDGGVDGGVLNLQMGGVVYAQLIFFNISLITSGEAAGGL